MKNLPTADYEAAHRVLGFIKQDQQKRQNKVIEDAKKSGAHLSANKLENMFSKDNKAYDETCELVLTYYREARRKNGKAKI